MAKPRFNRVPTASLDAVQDQIVSFAESVGKIAGGRLLRGVAVGTVETTIPHGAKGMPEGYCVMRIRGGATPYEVGAGMTEENIYLQASAAITVDIWIF